jgi:lysylphosphatidylglycerol synthetase-like protein (DUF2156 family)
MYEEHQSLLSWHTYYDHTLKLNSMFKKINIVRCLLFGTIAAIVFAIPQFFYIRSSTYSESWLLYLGSFFFFIAIVLYTVLFNKAKEGNANTVTMVFASHVTTVIGVIVSCILTFILLSVMIPGYLHAGPAAVASPDTPINEIHDKTNGLSFRAFIGATIINFAFGSFASIIFPFSIKRNQTKESGEPFPLNHRKSNV